MSPAARHLHGNQGGGWLPGDGRSALTELERWAIVELDGRTGEQIRRHEAPTGATVAELERTLTVRAVVGGRAQPLAVVSGMGQSIARFGARVVALLDPDLVWTEQAASSVALAMQPTSEGAAA